MSNPWGLGITHGTVTLMPHNPSWTAAFEHEATAIRAAAGARIVAIMHVGSIAIPGIMAKPLLDIMIGVADLSDGPALEPLFRPLGYEYVPDAGVPEDHIFGKAQPRTHLVHVVQYEGNTWHRHLLFRDRLRADPDLAGQYERLKLALAATYPDNRGAYTAAKRAFIDDVVGR